jgi:hypothetical protein
MTTGRACKLHINNTKTPDARDARYCDRLEPIRDRHRFPPHLPSPPFGSLDEASIGGLRVRSIALRRKDRAQEAVEPFGFHKISNPLSRLCPGE